MPTLTVNSGPLAGHQFNDLGELMEAQHALQTSCTHDQTTLTPGTAGKGLRRYVYARETCQTCKACLRFVRRPAPNFDEERRSTAEFWTSYRRACRGEKAAAYCTLDIHPQIGEIITGMTWFPGPTRRTALAAILENTGRPASELGKLVGLVVIE